MVIQANIEAMAANRYLGNVTLKNKKSTEKLSSGYRINRSADDAAGLAISEKMRRQIRGLTQASANAQDGISMVQIADGALAEIDDMLHRGTELSVQAANDTLTDDERSYIQQEIDGLKKEIDGIADRTVFNEIQVLKGSGLDGINSSNGVVIQSGLPDWVALGSTGGKLAETYTTTETFHNDDTQTDEAVAITHIAATLDFSTLDTDPLKAGELIGTGFYSTCCTCSDYYSIQFTSGTGNSVESSGGNYIFKIGVDGVTSADDLYDRIIAGTNQGNPAGHYTMITNDTSKTPHKLTVYDDRSSLSTDPKAAENGSWDSSWAHSSFGISAGSTGSNYGNFGPGIAYSVEDTSILDDTKELQLQVGAESGQVINIKLPAISTGLLGISSTDLSTQAGASKGISSFKNALAYVSKERTRMGTYQNRLEHTIKNLDNVIENTTSAESKIRDTDMATEMVDYSNSNILMQAGQSMLAQANQEKQGILALLQ